jgi:hypothetical protein
MDWNHRVIRDEEGMLRLVEMFYDDDTKKPAGHTEPFMCSETLEGLVELVNRLRLALTHPIIDVEGNEYVDPHKA